MCVISVEEHSTAQRKMQGLLECSYKCKLIRETVRSSLETLCLFFESKSLGPWKHNPLAGEVENARLLLCFCRLRLK